MLRRAGRGWGVLAAVVLVAGACSDSGERVASRGGEGTGDAPGEASPNSAQSAYDTARVVVHMGEHFWALGDAHDAAITGNLQGVREAAATLASHQPEASLPQVARPHMVRFLERSRAAAEVESSSDAGLALSQLAASCGTCHQALDRPLPVVIEEDPDLQVDTDGDSGLEAGMSAHIRGADLLWEALVAPSEEAWAAGIELLADTEIAPEAVTTSEESRRTVAGLLERLSGLAAAGRDASAAERPALYGALVTTCGECHRALDRGFGRQDPE